MKALEIAQGMEAAEANVKKLQSSELTQVNPIQQSTKNSNLTQEGRWKSPEWLKCQEKDKSSDKPCYHCGLVDHSPYKCHYQEVIRRKCNKTGHFAKVCRSQQPSVHSQYVNTVTGHDGSPEREAEFTIFTVGPKTYNPITVTLQIYGCL